MTQINGRTPEVLGGWKLPSLSDIGKALAAPLTAVTHTTMEVGRGIRDGDAGRIVMAPAKGLTTGVFDVGRGTGLSINQDSNAETQAKLLKYLRAEVAKISGSNYAKNLAHYKEMLSLYGRLDSATKKIAQADNIVGRTKLMNAYTQNVDILLNLYRSYLGSNNPAEVQGAIQNLTLDTNALVSTAHPTMLNSAIRNKGGELSTLITQLQAHGTSIAGQERSMAQEQLTQQGQIIAYETQGGKSSGFSLTSLLIPAALGVGALMIFKG